MNARAVGRIKTANFTADIPVRMFSWGAVAGGTAHATSAELTITKTIDASSPVLLKRAVASGHLSPLRLEVFDPGATTVQATYTFTDVFVRSVATRHPGRTNGVPLEAETSSM